MTDPLVAFLTARLDEAEAATNARRILRDGARSLACGRCLRVVEIAYSHDRGDYLEPCGHPLPDGFWEEHTEPDPDPAVLADVAAKRGILAQYEAVRRIVRERASVEPWKAGRIEQGALMNVLRHLATVYDQHPDYDPAWRP